MVFWHSYFWQFKPWEGSFEHWLIYFSHMIVSALKTKREVLL